MSVAHKTGEITKIHHDAAIVYAPRPFVLVILVRRLADRKDSAALMAEITRQLREITCVTQKERNPTPSPAHRIQ